MTQIRRMKIEEEPMGIVISRGSRAEASPRFRAYVWSEEPENAELPAETKAA